MSRVDVGKVTNLNGITELETKVTSLQGTVASHGTSIGTLQNDVDSIEGDMTTLQGTVATHGTDIGTLKTNVTSLQGTVATHGTNISTLQNNVINLQNDLNKLKPILVNIPANASTTISGYTSGNSDRRLLIFAHASNVALRGIYIALSTSVIVPLVEATGLTLSASGGAITVQNNTSNSTNGIILT